jgi:signal peptidase II
MAQLGRRFGEASQRRMTRTDSPRVPANRYWVFFGLAFGGVTWDLYSKWAVFEALGVRRSSGWTWPDNWGWAGLAPIIRFQLHTNFNPGALWGMGQGFALFFAGLSVIAALGILYWLFLHKGAVSWWMTVALGFVMAGVLGNLYDRLGLHGWTENGKPLYAVRDFLHFWFFGGTQLEFHWAIFNFADVFLVTGAIMLVIHTLFLQPAANPASNPVQATAR